MTSIDEISAPVIHLDENMSEAFAFMGWYRGETLVRYRDEGFVFRWRSSLCATC